MIRSKFKIGNMQIEVEASNTKELVKLSGFFADVPDKCGGCGGGDVRFFERSPGGNLYLGLRCSDCNYEFNFSQHKEGGGLFIRGDQQWQAPYGGSGETRQPRQQEQSWQQNDSGDDGEIPF